MKLLDLQVLFSVDLQYFASFDQVNQWESHRPEERLGRNGGRMANLHRFLSLSLSG
jgi:hypothetical protein